MEFIIRLLLGCILIFGTVKAITAGVTNKTNKTNNTIYEPIIVGGSYASEGQFPFQVLVFNDNMICGGSIVTRNYVLTAAHCVELDDQLYVRAGTIIIDTGGEVVKVKDKKIHPDNDIALVRLERSLVYNDKIHSIQLDGRTVPGGSQITIVGWGTIYTGGPTSNLLKFNVLSSLSDAECKAQYTLAKDIICINHPAYNGACHGDSGGPAIYNGRLVGVANFVVDGCGTSNPDGYAKISANLDWIINNTACSY